jgi:SAM-dependent methyltransferase
MRAKAVLETFLAAPSLGPEVTVLRPADFVLAAPPALRVIPYAGTLGVETATELLMQLRGSGFGTVTVLGSRPRSDFDEIVFACYVSADRKEYLDAAGGSEDIVARWQGAVRPDFAFRPVEITSVTKDDEKKYIASVHRWVAAQLQFWEYGRPVSLYERSPDKLLYQAPRLSYDLVQNTPDLQVEAFDEPYSTMMLSDGRIVRSADHYRSMANFVTALADIDSVLDVGCGSGFLACHLAGSGRYRTVAGVDAAAPRAAGARLHGRLAGLPAIDFRQMSMDRLDFPDRSFDLVVTSFALEQSGSALGRVISELRRVARKFLVLFEPTTEFFPTLASMWHLPANGWANQYARVLSEARLSYAVRPNLLSQYYNPGTVFVIDLQTDRNPVVSLPHLFRLDVEAWPGGVRFD